MSNLIHRHMRIPVAALNKGLVLAVVIATSLPASVEGAAGGAADPAPARVYRAAGVELQARSVSRPSGSAALDAGGIRPLTFTSADLDGDGLSDLIVSWETVGAKGLLALHRGDRTAGAFFLSKADLLEIPAPAEFLVSGDFDADGLQDLAAARRHSNELMLLAGDGAGGFLQPESLQLPGAVTALVSADVNRRDALEDLLVGVAGPGGSKLLVFESPEGAARAVPETIALPAPAVAVSVGRIDDQPLADIAVAAGRHLVLISGRDRRLFASDRIRQQAAPLSVRKVEVPEPVTGLAEGDFDGDGRDDVVLRLASGRLAHRMAADPDSLITGPEVEGLAPNPGEPLSDLSVASLGFPAGEALLAIDAPGRRLRVEAPETGAAEGDWIDLDAPGQPVALLPMRLNGDGLSDLVVLYQDPASVSVLETGPLSTFTVTNTADSGGGSLRQAILSANATGGADLITFSIVGTGPHTITPASALPTITDPVTIDATPEKLPSGAPGVVLAGTSAGSANGLLITTQDSVVRALTIKGFTLDGIQIFGGARNSVEGCYLGVDPNGMVAAGNRRGVAAVNSSDTVVGAGTSSSGNLISGNVQSGVEFFGSGTVNSQVQFGKIGTTASGSARLPNALDGIRLSGGANDNVIAFNTISGNDGSGIGTNGTTSGLNFIRFNQIGTDPAGLISVSNATGVSIVSTDNIVQQNQISGNSGDGVALLSGAGVNLIQQNAIGTKPVDPPAALPNGSNGILVSQSPNNTIRQNFVSGNALDGIRITGTAATGNDLLRNFVGIGDDLVTPVGNGTTGINLTNESSGTTVGVLVTPGGDLGNLVAFNDLHGILVDNSPSNVILGNSIFGNMSDGILLSQALTTGNDIRRNLIGVVDDLSTPMGNGADGINVELGASGNLIGQAEVRSEANIIAYNGGDGVSVIGGTPNPIRTNVITGNAGLGIDLGGDGVTPNDIFDGDTGPNNLQNFPVLTMAGTSGGDITIEGSLHSTPGRNFRVDFYSSPTCDPSGNGEGESYIGTRLVITLISGDSLPFSFDIVAAVPRDYAVTATATSLLPADDTSEFSACTIAGVRGPMMLSASAEMSSDGTALSWEPVAGAVTYNMYRGTEADLPNLPVQLNLAPTPNSCTRWSGTTPHTEAILTDVPPVGSMFWYLMTAVGIYEEGGVQEGSNGPREIVSSGPCQGAFCQHDKCVQGDQLSPSCGSCVATICNADPFCCNTAWDSLCVQEVRTHCNNLTCPESQGNCNHTGCSIGPLLTPGCDDPPVTPGCVDQICAVDPFCCEVQWDFICVGEVTTVCGKECD